MKKVKFLLVIVMVSLLLTLPLIAEVKANPSVMNNAAKVYFDSPKNGTQFNRNFIHFNVTVEVSKNEYIESNPVINGSLDHYGDSDWRLFEFDATANGTTSDGWLVFNGENSLANISEGTHTLDIYHISTSRLDPLFNYTIVFSIDTIPPAISNLSIENKTYYTSAIPLDFRVNEQTSIICYSLDDYANVTINCNSTLTDLFTGNHKLTIYANDTVGNMVAKTVYFTVALPNENPMNIIPIVLVIFLILAVVTSFIYRKKYSTFNTNKLAKFLVFF